MVGENEMGGGSFKWVASRRNKRKLCNKNQCFAIQDDLKGRGKKKKEWGGLAHLSHPTPLIGGLYYPLLMIENRYLGKMRSNVTLGLIFTF